MTVADVVVIAPAVIIVAYGAYRFATFALGRIAGAIERRRRPVTDQEFRALADERAAREALRPHGSVEVFPIHPPINGYHEEIS